MPEEDHGAICQRVYSELTLGFRRNVAGEPVALIPSVLGRKTMAGTKARRRKYVAPMLKKGECLKKITAILPSGRSDLP